jgi:hypothetical protein
MSRSLTCNLMKSLRQLRNSLLDIPVIGRIAVKDNNRLEFELLPRKPTNFVQQSNVKLSGAPTSYSIETDAKISEFSSVDRLEG